MIEQTGSKHNPNKIERKHIKRQLLIPIVTSHIAELAGLSSDQDQDMELVIDSIRFAPYDRLFSDRQVKNFKRGGLSRVVFEIGSVADLNKWDPDSSEVRYMTGVLFQAHIGRRIEWFEGQIEEIKRGSRKYTTDELTAQHQQEEEAIRAKLKEINLTLTENLAMLASENLLGKENGEEYVKVLGYFARLSDYFADHQMRNRVRVQVSRYMDKKMIKQALDYISERLQDVS